MGCLRRKAQLVSGLKKTFRFVSEMGMTIKIKECRGNRFPRNEMSPSNFWHVSEGINALLAAAARYHTQSHPSAESLSKYLANQFNGC